MWAWVIKRGREIIRLAIVQGRGVSKMMEYWLIYTSKITAVRYEMVQLSFFYTCNFGTIPPEKQNFWNSIDIYGFALQIIFIFRFIFFFFSESRNPLQPPIQRNAANARERARMRVLSSAFCRLKTRLPWVPADTKLSKLDTLRLATIYIQQLRASLSRDEDDDDDTKCNVPNSQSMVSML